VDAIYPAANAPTKAPSTEYLNASIGSLCP